MKIGINFQTKDDFISGVEYYSLGLINALLNNIDQHQYIIYTNRPALIKKHTAKAPHVQIRALPHLHTRLKRIIWEHTQLPWIIRKDKLDVLHCPHYICPLWHTGIPYVVTIHDTFALDHPNWCTPSNALYYRLMLNRTVSQAHRIISVSQKTAHDLNRHFPTVQNKTRIIHPGIDSIFSVHNNQTQDTKVISKYNLSSPYILYVGNVEPKKNLEGLLEAYQYLKKNGIPHKLVLVGHRTWRTNHLQQTIQKGIQTGNIITTGYVDRQDLPSIYRMASVSVLVSHEEGFGFPALEAMACGTPTVTSGKGILAEWSPPHHCHIASNTPRAIADTIQNCLRSSEKNNNIENATNIINQFNWKEAANQTLATYRECREAA